MDILNYLIHFDYICIFLCFCLFLSNKKEKTFKFSLFIYGLAYLQPQPLLPQQPQSNKRIIRVQQSIPQPFPLPQRHCNNKIQIMIEEQSQPLLQPLNPLPQEPLKKFMFPPKFFVCI